VDVVLPTLEPSPERLRPDDLRAVLEVLRAGDGPSPAALARRARLSRSRATAILDHLRRAGRLDLVRPVAGQNVRIWLRDAD
jgi:hypothetical protein